jgi:hypothetical protein
MIRKMYCHQVHGKPRRISVTLRASVAFLICALEPSKN